MREGERKRERGKEREGGRERGGEREREREVKSIRNAVLIISESQSYNSEREEDCSSYCKLQMPSLRLVQQLLMFCTCSVGHRWSGEIQNN